MALLFGLTGGIACGKSTVAAFMREQGVGIIDADVIAREVVQPGTEGLARIEQAFGPAVIAPDGTLDRKALGARVFGDEAARQLLNAITHPLIRAASMQRARELEASGVALIGYEAALLVEVGQADAFRPLVVVVASEATQLQRLMKRDGISEEQARARIGAQMPVREKAALADYVLDSSGSLDEVRRKTIALIRELGSRN
jgi:dephospho-CoA kinase